MGAVKTWMSSKQRASTAASSTTGACAWWQTGLQWIGGFFLALIVMGGIASIASPDDDGDDG